MINIPEKPFIIENINTNFLKEYCILPIGETDEKLTVLVPEEFDYSAISILSRQVNKKIEIHHYDKDEIERILYKWYEAQLGYVSDDDTDIDTILQIDNLEDIAQEAPIIRLVNNYINYAKETGASDIHFEPTKNNFIVRFRIDGILHEIDKLSKKVQPAITSRIKLIANMNIAESRIPQDGRILIQEEDENLDIRVSSVPTIFGESIVLRLLSKEKSLLNLEVLGMNNDHLKIFKQLIRKPYGLILVTGPTGSGKTTTLYAALNDINTPDKKIITVEDPVEYQLEGINQIQVKPEIGLNFANILRSILRQDPDIILVGEIRDSETAKIAIQSSLTGHLVFSTLHTNDAIGAFSRLKDLGVENFLLSSAVIASMAQRLVRKICPYCKKEYTPKEEEINIISKEFNLNSSVEKLYKGDGCKKCAYTGYKGRIAIYEILINNDSLRKYIIQEEFENNPELKEYLNKNFISMKQDGLQKALQGITTIEEVLRVVQK